MFVGHWSHNISLWSEWSEWPGNRLQHCSAAVLQSVDSWLNWQPQRESDNIISFLGGSDELLPFFCKVQKETFSINYPFFSTW